MSAPVAASPSQNESEPRIGQLLAGRYRVLRAIGVGGMGEVYEAENVRIGKRVALKILARSLASDPELVERFARESRAATAASGPHVVDMLDVGRTDDDLPFLVMELLEGQPLSRLLAEGPLPLETAIDLGVQIARGLSSAHQAGVVHRDLKPDNVFVVRSPSGGAHIKILDFGISKVKRGEGTESKELTRTGSALGTPSHMAPEQIEAKSLLDARTDLWALGVLLYQMLTGRLPFEGESYGLMLVRILGDAPAEIRAHAPDVPDAVAAIVGRCLKKSPEDRWESAAMIETALLGWRSAPVPDSVAPTIAARPAAMETPAVAPATPSRPVMTPASRTPASGARAASTREATSPFALGEGFRAPRDRFPIDIDSVLRAIPEGASVKGLFLQSVVDRVPDRKALFAKAGVAERRIVPFLDFPYGDYMRVLTAAAETVHPQLARTQALRRFHFSFYETFAGTLAGKVMFGVMGRDAGRIMPIGAKGWQVNVKLGAVTAETLGDKHVRYTFAGYPALICECCDVGVIEGAMKFFGEPQAVVKIRTPSLDHSEVDITW